MIFEGPIEIYLFSFAVNLKKKIQKGKIKQTEIQ